MHIDEHFLNVNKTHRENVNRCARVRQNEQITH